METPALYSADQLIEAAGRLPDVELNEFVRQVVQLGAARRTPSLSTRETELLQKVFAEESYESLERYQELLKKRDSNELSAEELSELLSLSDRMEVVHAERMSAIADLARLRGISLSETLAQLGVGVPETES
jgi:hypothetical protein